VSHDGHRTRHHIPRIWPRIEVDNRELIIRTVELARDRNVDFANAYLALLAAERGEMVCAFDESGFRRLPVEWMVPG
jgi:hypothetical protein